MRCRGACAGVDLTGRTILDLSAAANRLGCLAKDATDSGTGSVATGTLAQPFVGLVWLGTGAAAGSGTAVGVHHSARDHRGLDYRVGYVSTRTSASGSPGSYPRRFT